MCGFIFIYDKKVDLKKAKLSLNTSLHRGPDEQKIVHEENIFMGFNRLSIQDLSQNGSQPMYENTNNNDFFLMFNGEIYNFKDIKNNDNFLKNERFKSQSDTEVICKLYSYYGIKKTLDKINGMFALCLYDKKKRKLYLARDIFGQKPLYFYSSFNQFIASSEIKNISNYIDKIEPDFFGSINPILQTGNSPSNLTMFKNVKRILPGEILELNLFDGTFTINKHLKLNNLINENEYHRISKLNEKSLLEEYDHCLVESVKQHSISDAPMAVSASLGLDSSLILGVMNDVLSTEVNSISYISHFDKSLFSEKSVKDFISKNNHEYFEQNNKTFIENLIYSTYYSETIGREDNMILSEISNIANKKKFKVLVTGDGADELFGSIDYQQKFYYNSMGYYNKYFRKINLALKNYFPLLFNIFVYHSPRNDGYFIYPNHLASMELSSDILFYNGARKNDFNSCLDTYSFIKNESEKNYKSIILDDLNHRFQRFLNRSDSYGMQNSVEVRLPYLDKKFVTLCLNTPISKKIKFKFLNLDKKSILKKIAKKYDVPNKIIYRKKTGTDFVNKENYYKILKNHSFKYTSELFKISEKKITNRLTQSNIRYYSREIFSFLSAEVLFKMFIEKNDPKELHLEYKKLLKS